jgi:hypothetical protein
MRSTELATVLIVFALAACDRPQAFVICHNANCAAPIDPNRDDSIDGLRDSLATEFGGQPVIDGVEIDTFWRGSDDTCLFAHDLENDQTPAMEPATELAAYFARPGPISHGDGPFQVMIELKSYVSADGKEQHSDAQLALHAACAWQVYGVLADAAVANDRDVRVLFEAFRPDLLRVMVAQTPASTPLPVRYGAILAIPRPLDSETRNLDEYAGVPIDIVEFHAQWILDGQYEAVRSMGLDIAVFMFSATSETFAVIEQYQPVLVVTNEAELMRRWLDR